MASQQREKFFDKLRYIYEREGFQACLDHVKPYDIKGILVCEGLDADYYKRQAEGFVKEMEKDFPDENYLIEKLASMIELFEVLHRFGDMPNRHGTKSSKEFWDAMDRKMWNYKAYAL